MAEKGRRCRRSSGGRPRPRTSPRNGAPAAWICTSPFLRANTDGTRPAYIDRVDVYALNSPAAVPPERLLETGAPIASVRVKGPRDPDDVIGPNDPQEDLEPLTGPGLDQGATARVLEDLSTVASGDGECGASGST